MAHPNCLHCHNDCGRPGSTLLTGFIGRNNYKTFLTQPVDIVSYLPPKFIDILIKDHQITAFIDSGASHCLMSENMFQTLQRSHGDLKLLGTHDGQQIDTAGDTSLKIIGHFVDKMVFNGHARNKPIRVSIENKIYVARHLRMPFILGADILFSPSCISLSHSQIVFKHEEGDIIIPTSTTKDSKLHVMHSSTQECVIKPFTQSNIPLQVINDKLSSSKNMHTAFLPLFRYVELGGRFFFNAARRNLPLN